MRSLLWLMVVIAVGLTAYQSGFQKGLREAVNQRQWVGTAYSKVYNVADLAAPVASGASTTYADDLIKNLTTEVLPRTWQDKGGAASIAGYEAKRWIVVNHDHDGHERIAEYLEELRTTRN